MYGTMNIKKLSKSFRKLPPEIKGNPKTKCSAVASILARNNNVDCTASSIQCI
jgi:hypothetical protein